MMKTKHKKERSRFKIIFCVLAFAWIMGIYFFSPVIQSDVSNNVTQADLVQMNVGWRLSFTINRSAIAHS